MNPVSQVDQQSEQSDWFHPVHGGNSASPANSAGGGAPAAPPGRDPAAGPAAGPGPRIAPSTGSLTRRTAPGTPAADGAPATAIPVSGQVRASGGGPVPGAAITLADLSGRQLAVTKTGPAGQYRLAAPGPGSYLVIVSAQGHQPAAGTLTADGAGARHDVVLRGGSGLAGTVRVEGSGQPVPGAMVTVADSRGEIAGVTTTGPDGSFRLTQLAEGHYALVVAATAYTPVAAHVAVKEGQLLRSDVEIPASGRVAGTVLDADGDRPFGGARLSLVDETGSEVAATTADENGNFTFSDVPSGSYTLVASGYRPGVVALQPGDRPSQQADITLGPPEH